MRVYLDVCCLNRLFDDQNQNRIHLETEAIYNILARCNKGEWGLVSSLIVEIEVDKIPDEDRKQKVLALCDLSTENVEVDEQVEKRALEMRNLGFKTMDALHIACAEKAGVDAFVTTDDKLLKTALRGSSKIKVRVVNPLSWLLEIGEN